MGALMASARAHVCAS